MKQKSHVHMMNMTQSKFFFKFIMPRCHPANNFLLAIVRSIYTEELSMERYAICDDNPLAIDYRNFSHLVNSNP